MVISSLKAIAPAKTTTFIKSYCINYGSPSLRKWVDTSTLQILVSLFTKLGIDKRKLGKAAGNSQQLEDVSSKARVCGYIFNQVIALRVYLKLQNIPK
uniref:Uncharacterized protein n=1 Tax=Cucumis melo TaxID=3656 RepID=A0A9I9EAC0_CUCME